MAPRRWFVIEYPMSAKVRVDAHLFSLHFVRNIALIRQPCSSASPPHILIDPSGQKAGACVVP